MHDKQRNKENQQYLTTWDPLMNKNDIWYKIDKLSLINIDTLNEMNLRLIFAPAVLQFHKSSALMTAVC